FNVAEYDTVAVECDNHEMIVDNQQVGDNKGYHNNMIGSGEQVYIGKDYREKNN
ncbi:unnamed protein product, partial [Rotaria sordida]